MSSAGPLEKENAPVLESEIYERMVAAILDHRLPPGTKLVSRTSLILMTYSTSHSRETSQAATCRCQEHRALLDAIRLRDPREASRLMREHLVQLESQLRFTPPPAEAPDLVSLFGQAGPARLAHQFVTG